MNTVAADSYEWVARECSMKYGQAVNYSECLKRINLSQIICYVTSLVVYKKNLWNRPISSIETLEIDKYILICHKY